MKKKFILFAMMLLTLVGGVKFNVLNAQETITIGEGAEYNYGYVYSPLPTNYNYSITQHIYTSAEMNDGTPGTISSIILYTSNVYDVNRKVEIYLMNTDKSGFTSPTDWVNMTAANLVYDFNSLDGSDTDIPTSGTWTIDINDFEYTGGNLLLCINDKTGLCPNYNPSVITNYNTNSYRTVKAMNDNYGQYDPKNIVVTGSSNNKVEVYNPKITFTIEAAAAGIEVTPTSIALGEVRMGEFFTEKAFAPKNVEVKVTSTKVTSVTCDNSFFTINGVPEGDDLGKTFTFNVGYNKKANVTGTQEGIITIKWADGEDVKIPISATPYTATAPDAIEAFTEVAFTDNAYTNTPTFGDLHDDYILPGETEETDGNAPDAVYKFTLDSDATISASVTGADVENSYLAIYSEDFGAKDGPSSDNNNTGVQAAPAGPTTFFYDFNDGSLDDFTTYNYDSYTNYNWDIEQKGPDGTNSLISYSYKYISPGGSSNITDADQIIMTNDKYVITPNSKLLFDARCHAANDPDYISIKVSKDGNEFIYIDKPTPGMGSFLNVEVDLGAKFEELGLEYGEYHIALHHDENFHMYIIVDNLQLTDGSSKSRGLAPAIDAVQYPAGTYYLVAAADKAFTVNISTASVPAPAEFALTAPEDEAPKQDNPKLTWEAAQYASSYNVYIGTSEDFTNVEPIVVTTNSYQTEDLQNNTKYYWTVEAVNAKGTTATTSGTWSFVTTLDVPQNVTVTSENHIAGGDITLTWDGIDGAKYKYNVYVGDICHNGTTPITATKYTISNVDYNKEGWNITVTAVYEGLGESKRSDAVNVKVTGYGQISVNVNGGISKVNYTINGTDEFGNAVEEITGTTDNVGMATVKVLAGTYTVTVSKIGYKDFTTSSLLVGYNATMTVDINMQANPAAPFEVTAVDNVTTANVSWTTDDYTTFNVYRRNVQTDEVEKIASNVYYKQYQDAAWNEFAAGDKYVYGVSTYVEGDAVTLMNEGFETYTPVCEQSSGSFYWNRSNWNVGYYYNGYYNSVSPKSGYSMFASNTSGQYYNSNATFITQTIDLTGYVSPSLSFWFNNDTKSSWYQASLDVLVRVDGGEWEKITTINEKTNGWVNKTYNTELSNYSGKKIEIGFKTYQYYSRVVGIDDVVVTAVPMSESAINWAPTITKEEWVAFDGTEDNTWSAKNVLVAADHTIDGEVTVKKLTVNGGKLTVAKDAKLTVNEKTVNATAANFVIEDGAQVFQPSADVKATFNMGVLKPEEWSNENKEGWNFVSSPFTNAGLSQFTFDLTGAGLDLYRYNGAEVGAEWRHYNGNNAEFASNYFDLGYGYMLAHETKESVALFGSLNKASEHTWEVTYTENADNGDLANFHLVGNPFTFNMDMSMSKLVQTNMVEGYAVLNAKGNGYTYATTGAVNVGDAFFVKTTAADATMSYKHFERATKGESANSLNIIATSAEGSDNVIVNLAGEKEGFNKLQNFNEAIATVYIQHEDKNYGIFNCNEDVQEIELCFNANQMGNYTISIEPNGKFQSVTLVDRFTGIETNMLLEDYNFTAMSNVNNNRFIVKLVNGQQSTDNSHFAYQSGEDLIIEAEGAVEIIDMMGRVVYASEVESANNRINVSEFNNAAYLIRVVNEEGVKVQKLIVNSL